MNDLENNVALGDFEPIRLSLKRIDWNQAWLALDHTTQSDYWLQEMEMDWPEQPEISCAEALLRASDEELPLVRTKIRKSIIEGIYRRNDQFFSRLMNQHFGTTNTVWELR